MYNLKALRKQKGLKQQEVAEFIGITRAAYANIENGKRETDFTTLKKLADYFNVSIDYLFGKTDDPTPSNEKKQTPGFITPEDVMEAAERQKGRPLTAEERAELLIRINDLMATLVRIKRESE